MKRLKEFLTYISLPFLLLHLIVRFCGKKRLLFEQDQEFTYRLRANPFTNKVLQFSYYIVFLPEYRNVFYYRVGFVGKVMNLYLRKCNSLYIKTPIIGGGMCIQHGHSTEVNAKKIGCHCHIFQNVTIGTNGSLNGPTIGDNCLFGTGCVVIGDIHIGNNVKIGANAVVVKDVPDNCTVVMKGTMIVKKNNERVSIEL